MRIIHATAPCQECGEKRHEVMEICGTGRFSDGVRICIECLKKAVSALRKGEE
jgi:hypothetical protein